MTKYLMYVGIPIEVEAEDIEMAMRSARFAVYNNLGNYAVYDLGVEMIEELEDVTT